MAAEVNTLVSHISLRTDSDCRFHLEQTRGDNRDIVHFCYYLDHVVFALGEAKAPTLVVDLLDSAAIAFRSLLSGEVDSQKDRPLFADFALPSYLPVHHVSSELLRMSDGRLRASVCIEPKYEPSLADTLSSGVHFLFRELFESSDPLGRHLLAAVSLAQCCWYKEHGPPQPDRLGFAPKVGLSYVELIGLSEQAAN